MPRSRIFIAHEALERWVADGRAEVEADLLNDKETGRRFRVTEAVRFLEEVSGQSDAAGLVGKVKSLTDLVALGGEHMADSVILGDNAYRVQQGLLGTLLVDERSEFTELRSSPRGPEHLPNAQTIVALQKFFLHNVK
jgi:hypothetical protein